MVAQSATKVVAQSATINLPRVDLCKFRRTVTTRVSVASDGTEGNGRSYEPDISADGRYVAFTSQAANLVEGEENLRLDIFVHDRDTGETTRISAAPDGTEGNGSSNTPAISDNGNYVLFQSVATNLVPGDTNLYADTFIHNRITGTTTRISIAPDGTEGNGNSESGAISTDGNYVAFYSIASNLVPGDTNAASDIFITKVDFSPPTIISHSLNPTYAGANGPGTITVTFSENMTVLAGEVDAADITSPANYLLVEAGSNGIFDTISCVNGRAAEDRRVYVDRVAYDRGTDTATVTINGGEALMDGIYRFLVCGTTSVYDMVGNALNGGADYSYYFTVGAAHDIRIFMGFLMERVRNPVKSSTESGPCRPLCPVMPSSGGAKRRW